MLALPLPTSTRQSRREQNHIPMSQDINIKDCRKAVNQAKYMPTAERKANALKLLKQLTEAISNLKEVKPKAKAKPKAKPLSKKAKAKPKAKAKAKLSKRAIAEAKVAPKDLAKLTKAQLLAMLSSQSVTKAPKGVAPKGVTILAV